MKQLPHARVAKSWQKKKKRRISLAFTLPKKTVNKRTAGLLLLMLLMGVTAYALFFSSYFRMKNVSVRGNQSLEREEIENLVRSSWTEDGHAWTADNYFFLSTEKLERKIGESFNEIESVRVTKEFPDGLQVEIREKNPALIWCRRDCYFVNEQGVAFLIANEAEMVSQAKHFIKISEEEIIAEESVEERAAMEEEAGSKDAPNATESAAATEEGNGADPAETAATDSRAELPPIALNEQVADESFIRFTLDINNRLSYNAKLKIKYYKTKGYRTRELIAFTDKNTKLYFDTTTSAEKQANNLSTVLDKSIEKDRIDSLQYIYLKNEDRVFYK